MLKLFLGHCRRRWHRKGHPVTNKATYVKPGEIPYQVSVQAGGKHMCSGALIDELHVLGSARCFVWNGKNYNATALGELDVVVGIADLKDKSGEQRVPVTEIIVPTDYDATHGRAHVKDLAVIKVRSTIAYYNYLSTCACKSSILVFLESIF